MFKDVRYAFLLCLMYFTHTFARCFFKWKPARLKDIICFKKKKQMSILQTWNLFFTVIFDVWMHRNTFLFSYIFF